MILLGLLAFGWLVAYAEYLDYIPYSKYHKIEKDCDTC